MEVSHEYFKENNNFKYIFFRKYTAAFFRLVFVSHSLFFLTENRN